MTNIGASCWYLVRVQWGDSVIIKISVSATTRFRKNQKGAIPISAKICVLPAKHHLRVPESSLGKG